MIIKQYLLTTKPWMKRSNLLYSIDLDRVSRRTGKTLRAQHGVSYANSRVDDFSSVFTRKVKFGVSIITTKRNIFRKLGTLVFKSSMRLGTQHISKLVGFYLLKIYKVTHE